MPRVEIALPRDPYPVVIEPGALDAVGELAAERAPHARCALVADPAVFARHGARAVGALAKAGYGVTVCELPGGEAEKTLATVAGLYERFVAARLERRSPVVALGGGVTGDVAGFAAASFLRGLPFVQVPTSLLAMVDSSVGGKTGVNLPQGKNLVGAFHQPVAVAADPELLATLPARELRCGLAECIKHGVIRDASLVDFVWREAAAVTRIEPGPTTELVRRNVEIKAAVVVADEREAGVRAHLNLGHTFGHAIEATAGYGEILHGEAVGLGLLAAARCAHAAGLCAPEVEEGIRAAMRAVGLATSAPLPGDDALLAAMRHDKKVADDRLRLVLPSALGTVAVHDDVPVEAIRAGWAAVRGETA